jgi:hypothetical protein
MSGWTRGNRLRLLESGEEFLSQEENAAAASE